MGGSALGAVIAMLGHVGDHAPHGGLIVLPVVVHRWWYLAAIAIGTVAVAVVINVLRSLAHPVKSASETP